MQPVVSQTQPAGFANATALRLEYEPAKHVFEPGGFVFEPARCNPESLRGGKAHLTVCYRANLLKKRLKGATKGNLKRLKRRGKVIATGSSAGT